MNLREDHLMMYRTIGEKITHYRKKKRISQSDFAELVGLSRSSISNIEKGRQSAPVHVLSDIAKALEVDLYDVIPNCEIETSNEALIEQVKAVRYLSEHDENCLREFLITL